MRKCNKGLNYRKPAKEKVEDLWLESDDEDYC